MLLVFLLAVAWGGPLALGHDIWRMRNSELLDNKILGGRRATEGEFPWAVSLRFSQKNLVPPSGHYCGGSLVSRSIVITACHCAVTGDVSGSVKPYQTRDKRILAGSLKSDPKAEGAQLRKMEKMMYHPKCRKDPIRGRGWLYDFAYAIPDRPFEFNQRVQPVPVYTPASSKEARKFRKSLVSKRTLCQSSGFGYTAVDKEGDYTGLSLELKAIGLNIFDNGKCEALLCDFHPDYCNISLSSKKNICAMSPTGGDVCKGDSGSTIICQGVAIGLTSWGPLCGEGDEKVPTMYAMIEKSEGFFTFFSGTDDYMPVARKSDGATTKARSGAGMISGSLYILLPCFLVHLSEVLDRSVLTV